MAKPTFTLCGEMKILKKANGCEQVSVYLWRNGVAKVATAINWNPQSTDEHFVFAPILVLPSNPTISATQTWYEMLNKQNQFNYSQAQAIQLISNAWRKAISGERGAGGPTTNWVHHFLCVPKKIMDIFALDLIFSEQRNDTMTIRRQRGFHSMDVLFAQARQLNVLNPTFDWKDNVPQLFAFGHTDMRLVTVSLKSKSLIYSIELSKVATSFWATFSSRKLNNMTK